MPEYHSEKRLPDRWAEWLTTQPETGMTYHVGDVLLRDGSRVNDVVFVGDQVVEVREHASVPFDPADIVEIRLTHRRWHFRR